MMGMARPFTHAEIKSLSKYLSSLPGELKTVPQVRLHVRPLTARRRAGPDGFLRPLRAAHGTSAAGTATRREFSMNRLLPLRLLAAALAASRRPTPQTLRWASQGDPQTMDPHSQNESMTNMMNGQVYEGLVARDKKLGLAPALAPRGSRSRRCCGASSCGPDVKFHDGTPFTADDVVYLDRARRSSPTSQISNYATRRRRRRGRSTT